MTSPGLNLRTLREKLGLTVGDVETGGERLARKHNNEEYLITITRLSDFETKFFIRWCASTARPIRGNKATVNQPPVLKLCRGRVLFQRTATRQQLGCAKTLSLCSQRTVEL